MTRGAGWFSPPKALARKRSAAAASRLAERRKSIVAPVESSRQRNAPQVSLIWTQQQVTAWQLAKYETTVTASPVFGTWPLHRPNGTPDRRTVCLSNQGLAGLA